MVIYGELFLPDKSNYVECDAEKRALHLYLARNIHAEEPSDFEKFVIF